MNNQVLIVDQQPRGESDYKPQSSPHPTLVMARAVEVERVGMEQAIVGLGRCCPQALGMQYLQRDSSGLQALPSPKPWWGCGARFAGHCCLTRDHEVLHVILPFFFYQIRYRPNPRIPTAIALSTCVGRGMQRNL